MSMDVTKVVTSTLLAPLDDGPLEVAKAFASALLEVGPAAFTVSKTFAATLLGQGTSGGGGGPAPGVSVTKALTSVLLVQGSGPPTPGAAQPINLTKALAAALLAAGADPGPGGGPPPDISVTKVVAAALIALIPPIIPPIDPPPPILPGDPPPEAPEIIVVPGEIFTPQDVNTRTTEFRYYGHRFHTIALPVNPATWQTDWTDNGYPYDKYWKEAVIEFDSHGQARQLRLEIDHRVAQTFTIQANGRTQFTQSFQKDILGKLGRIVITGGETSFFSVKFVTLNEPPDVTYADTYELTLGYERWKFAKRFWITYKAKSLLTYAVYCDERLRATGTLPVSTLPTGWVKSEVNLPPLVKGKLIRIVFSANQPFKIYWNQTSLEWKPIGADRGYEKYQFTPPQLM